ncbi:hypothetical protein [Providencia rettgeri]|uniref:hypothetical protein n=2 Tax=Morganellaceae TaxID=1903414 RepID=UPI0032DAEE82
MLSRYFLFSSSLLSFSYAFISDLTSQYDYNLITFFFLLSFSIFLITNLKKGFSCLSTFSFWFLFFNFMYMFIGPIYIYYFSYDFFPKNHDYDSDIFVFNSALISYSLLTLLFSLFIHEPKNKQFNFYFIRNELLSNNKIIKLYIISSALFLFTLLLFFSSGLYQLSFSGEDRVTIKDYIDVDIWYLLGSIVSVFTCFIFTNYINIKNNRFNLFIIFLLSSTYYFIDLSIGGRKFLIYFSIVALFTLSKTNKLNVKKMLMIIIPIILAMLSRGLMDKVNWGERDIIDIIVGYVGEFIFTNLTSTITVYSNYASCDIYPSPINPYLSWIFYYIPRAFFELKPYSVAYNFSAYMDVGMGFALTPLTESLCAFRGLGPYIFPLIFTIIIYIIYKLSKKYPYIYILLISMVMDINRGEISYFINNIIFMFFIWYCLERVNKSK